MTLKYRNEVNSSDIGSASLKNLRSSQFNLAPIQENNMGSLSKHSQSYNTIIPQSIMNQKHMMNTNTSFNSKISKNSIKTLSIVDTEQMLPLTRNKLPLKKTIKDKKMHAKIQ